MALQFRAINPEYFKLGEDIIGAAFDVRKKTGRGLRETFYEAALSHELIKRGHKAEAQVLVPAIYDGIEISSSYIADIVVDDKVIIEVKAITSMREGEFRQLYTYLKLSNFKLGYLINFGAKDFKIGKFEEDLPYVNGIYRFVNGI